MASETLKMGEGKEESEIFSILPRRKQHRIELSKEEEEEKKISCFLEKLIKLNAGPFLMQKENIVDSPFMCDWDKKVALRRFQKYIDKYRDYVELEGIDLGDVKHYNLSELNEFTNNFSARNFFCDDHHGRLFKARISNRPVVVKTLDFLFPISHYIEYITTRLHDDIVLLRDPLIKSHPHFVKLIGYCCEKKLAFVYDVDPKATVHHLLTSDDFGWEARMNVAMDFGRLLNFSHDNLIIYGSIDAKGIMIDQDMNTEFFGFGFHQPLNNKNDKIEFVYQPCLIGYLALEDCRGRTVWSMKSDVCAYGVLLLNLITKRQEDREDWFAKEIKTGCKKSLVSDTFEMDEETGTRITELAMSCVDPDPTCRPDIELVLKNLEGLVGHHANLPEGGV